MYNQIVSGSTALDLVHSIINPNYEDAADLEHTSIITGKRTYIRQQDYVTYTVTEYLYKYSDSGVSHLSDLETLKNTLVYLRPKNGILQDRAGNEIYFYLAEIKPFYLDNPDRYGACTITLKSTKGLSKVLILASYGINYGEDYGQGF